MSNNKSISAKGSNTTSPPAAPADPTVRAEFTTAAFARFNRASWKLPLNNAASTSLDHLPVALLTRDIYETLREKQSDGTFGSQLLQLDQPCAAGPAASSPSSLSPSPSPSSSSSSLSLPLSPPPPPPSISFFVAFLRVLVSFTSQVYAWNHTQPTSDDRDDEDNRGGGDMQEKREVNTQSHASELMMREIFDVLTLNVRTYGYDAHEVTSEGTILHLLTSIKCPADTIGWYPSVNSLMSALLEQPNASYRPPVNALNEKGEHVLHFLFVPSTWTKQRGNMMRLLQVHGADPLIFLEAKDGTLMANTFGYIRPASVELLIEWLLIFGRANLDFEDVTRLEQYYHVHSPSRMYCEILRQLQKNRDVSRGGESKFTCVTISSESASQTKYPLTTRAWLRTQLDSIPERLFAGRLLDQYLYSNKRVTPTETVCKSILTQLIDKFDTTLASANAFASSSFSSTLHSGGAAVASSQLHQHLSERENSGSDSTLLACIFYAPTDATIRAFSQRPFATVALIMALQDDELDRTHSGQQSVFNFNTFHCTSLSKLLRGHRPMEQGDCIWLMLREIFHAFFSVDNGKTNGDGTAIRPNQKLHLSGPTEVQIPKLLSLIYEQLTRPSVEPEKNSIARKKLVVDLLADSGAMRYPAEKGIDFYAVHFEKCKPDDIQAWIDATNDTTDQLWPSRPPGAKNPIEYERDYSHSAAARSREELFETAHQKWVDVHWPRVCDDLSQHLIMDLALMVTTYLGSDSLPLSVTVRSSGWRGDGGVSGFDCAPFLPRVEHA